MKKIHSLKHKSSATQENHNPKLKSEKKILNESKKMENKDKGTVSTKGVTIINKINTIHHKTYQTFYYS